jgi:acetyltransferase
MNPLHKIMNPGSIAIVGASNNVMKMGTIQCLNLIGSGYPGRIFPVHPSEKEVLGRKAYPSIDALPQVPDVAVLVVPTRLVPEMIRRFGELGTKHAVIVSAGFSETGEGGVELQREIVRIAGEYGIRFLGPNCVGILNTACPLNLTVFPSFDRGGKLGVASQSGTFITQNLTWLHRNGIVIGKAMSVGNEANIDIVDCLDYFGEDEETTAVALYIEGIRRASAFLETARRISRKKPIVAQYVGGTEAGARSGSSHTGAIAGPGFIYEGLFAQAGIIAVDSIEEVFRTASALASQPPLRGKRIAVVTNSGGPGTAAADTLNRVGMDVPEFSEATKAAIRPFIAGHASARNPVDVTFDLDMPTLARKIPEILFKDEEIDGMIIHGIMDSGFFNVIVPMARKVLSLGEDLPIELPETDLEPLIGMPGRYGKPLLVSSFFDEEEDRCIRIFHKEGVPVFDSPEKAAKAMGAFHRHLRIRNRKESVPAGTALPPPREAWDLLEGPGRGALDEYRAKRIFAAYGIPVSREILVRTLPEAVEAAGAIGYPVVLKGCSPEILHKTEQGMVFLDLKSEDELVRAFRALRSRNEGIPVLVAEMLRGDREFMAGMTSAPGFPPCIVFGLGGVFAEVLKDHQVRLAPLGVEDAFEMMDSLQSRKLLTAYRGMKAVNRDSLASLLVALGRLAVDFPAIREMDLNPILIVNGEPRVADGLIGLRDPAGSETEHYENGQAIPHPRKAVSRS